MHLIPALKKPRQADLCEFKANLNHLSFSPEMVQQLRALAALAEDMGLVPNTHVATHNHL